MRAVASILLLLVLLGWMASIMPSSGSTAPSDSTWRRTVNGWEKGTWLLPGSSDQSPGLHPAAFAVLQVFLSVLALVLFPPLDGKPLPGQTTEMKAEAEPELSPRG